ncbi:hypothetical protein AKJ08_1565 [Vulgatibacter incomptus]|uniref:Glycosyl hydrolase family 32 N-terminal domain-containing protein n=2 Tax=Vulgatibacter incomptus TaxID=1391653 RepID=A0A0K1PCB3_9BACT|nr:hypothetical protein AKJ08_1565 [Vulgatibacter incomptus]
MGAATIPFEGYVDGLEGLLLIQDRAALDAVEGWERIAENVEVDWDHQTLALALGFPPEHELRLVRDGDRLELHVSRPIACIGGEDVSTPDFFSVQVQAYVVPKVSTATVVFHDGRYRVPTFQEDGTCRRDPDAPVLGGGGRVSVLKEGDAFRMWYEGYSANTGNVFDTRSLDGLAWTPGGWDFDHLNHFGDRGPYAEVYGPMVLPRPDGYWMFFTASGFGVNPARGVRRVSSVDGLQWTDEVPVIELEPFDDTKRSALRTPFVLEHDGRFWLWYASLEGDERSAIALAVSDDGDSWTPAGDGPVLLPGAPGSFDEAGVFSPAVTFHDGRFVMWYQGAYGGHPTSPFYSALGVATSPDGIHWTRKEQPILVARGGFEGGKLTGPRPLLDEGGYRLWYTGISDRHEPSIAHARCRW